MIVSGATRIIKMKKDGSRHFKLKCPPGQTPQKGDDGLDPKDHTCVPKSLSRNMNKNAKKAARKLRKNKSRKPKKSILFKRGLGKTSLRQRLKANQIRTL
jgi:hypothetical protein